jgi:CheY-like chemotaxis protein
MASSIRPFEGRRILVVDDNPTNIKLLSIALEYLGAAAVATATTISTAQQLLTSAPAPDLALLDHRLSATETSITLANWMRTQPHLQRTVRVSLSSTPPEVIMQGQPADLFAGFLSKPVGWRSLANRLLSLLPARN